VPDQPVMPSRVDHHVSPFDRFAAAASRFVSQAWFFAACVLVIVLWAPTILVIRDVNTWQLIVNTLTTIVTFLLVALLQNAQTRSDQATQHKLNAMAAGLAVLMEALAQDVAMRDDVGDEVLDAVDELRAAVGLEQRESS
jgi:low affinity Fe/Cu permease